MEATAAHFTTKKRLEDIGMGATHAGVCEGPQEIRHRRAGSEKKMCTPCAVACLPATPTVTQF
jgi:hypothetical protein